MASIQELIKVLIENNNWEKSVTLKRNEFLKLPGLKDLNIYFIVEGCLRLYVEDDLNEHIIRFGYQ